MAAPTCFSRTGAGGPDRDAIIRYLEQRYLRGLSKHIETEHRIDPGHAAIPGGTVGE